MDRLLLFLDTAELNLIKHWDAYGLVHGVTTNPALLARVGGDPYSNVQAIAKYVHPRPVSAQVTTNDVERMVRHGRLLSRISDNIVVKLPCNQGGLEALRQLAAEDIRTNITLTFDPSLGALFALNGATYVSLILGRTDDFNLRSETLVERTRAIFRRLNSATKILAASIRNPVQLELAMAAGADVITVPPSTWDLAFSNPLTRTGLQDFFEAWSAVDVDVRRRYEQY
ncbi:MAG: fructose-6-phosphate aldolase [Planctomycetes bacterium]|nr:fructose-6-phosphate aldolase [Planctomycetota bacterium]